MGYHGRVANGVVLLQEPGGLPDGTDVTVEPARTAPQQKAIELIDEWLDDESGYDERSWPELRTGIDLHRLSSRRLFNG